MNESSSRPDQTGHAQPASLDLLSQMGVNPIDILVAADKTTIQPAETKSSAANWRPLVISLLAALAVVMMVTAFVLTYLSIQGLQKQVAELKTKKPTVVALLTPTKTATLPPPVVLTDTPTAPPPPAPLVPSILTFDPASIDLGLTKDPRQVTVIVQAANQAPVASTTVTLNLIGHGDLTPTRLTTDIDGKAFFTYTPAQVVEKAMIKAACGQATNTLTVQPLPVVLALAPTEFDVGVGSEQVVTVTVLGKNDPQPVSGVGVSLVVSPTQSVNIQPTTVITTDGEGKALATLTFTQVMTGELGASVASGEIVSATIRVRPVAVNTSKEAKNLRAEASETSVHVGDFAVGSRLPIVGQSADGSWLLVRTGDGQQVWVKKDLVSVEGETTQVSVVTPTPAPTKPPATFTPTPTNTPTPKPAATKTAASPYPSPGSHDLVVEQGAGLAPMYRIGETGDQGILLQMPVHAVSVLAQDTKDASPPAGFVLVEATFFVDKARVSPQADGFYLSNPGDTAALACWTVVSDACQGTGTLAKASSPYFVSKTEPEKNGNFAKVTIWLWVKHTNLR